jgi:hypothetical protein
MAQMRRKCKSRLKPGGYVLTGAGGPGIPGRQGFRLPAAPDPGQRDGGIKP